MASALERHRDDPSRADLSLQHRAGRAATRAGVAAVDELANQLGMEHRVQIEVDVAPAARLGEKEQVGLYQIVRESLNQAVRRGRPSKISVTIQETAGGQIETIVADNGTGERARPPRAIGERASTLNGRFEVEQGADGGGDSVVLPAYAGRPTSDRIAADGKRPPNAPGGHLLFVWSSSGWTLQQRRRGPGRRPRGRG